MLMFYKVKLLWKVPRKGSAFRRSVRYRATINSTHTHYEYSLASHNHGTTLALQTLSNLRFRNSPTSTYAYNTNMHFMLRYNVINFKLMLLQFQRAYMFCRIHPGTISKLSKLTKARRQATTILTLL